MRNFAITLSGSAISTMLGVLLTPVTSRIFPPAAYGNFSLYMAVISNLTLVTTLSYPGAFLLPKRETEFYGLVKLTLLSTIGSVLLLSWVLWWQGEWLMHLMQIEGIHNWFYTIPLLLLLFNFNNVLTVWYLRNKEFARRAGVDIVSTLGSRLFTIGYGLGVAANVGGLLLGEFFNRLTNTVPLLLGPVRRDFRAMWTSNSWPQLWQLVREYKSYVAFNLPAGYVYVLSTQLPILVLAPTFGATAVGLYAFSLGLLELPINLMASAIAPVFQQRAAELYNDAPERLPVVTLELYNKLLYLALVPFGIITVYGDVLFKLVFGARWELAGLVTGYLGYYYVFKLLSLGTSGIYIILRKPQYVLYANGLLLLARVLGLSGGVLRHDFDLTLLGFGLASTVATFATDMHVLSLLKIPVWRVAIRSLLLVGITLVLLKLLRYGLAHYFSIFAPISGHL